MLKTLKKLDSVTDRVFNVISKICEIVGIAGLLGIMFLLAAQTVLKWFSVSLLWSDELVSLLNIWLVFTAAAVVSYDNKHVQVDFFTSRMPKIMQILFDIVISVLCLYACYHVLSGGIVYLQKTRNIKTNILRLPGIALYMAPLISMGFMGLLQVKQLIKLFFSLFEREERV